MDEIKIEYCTFYASYYEAIKDLEDHEQLKIFQSIFDYTFNSIEPNLNGVCKIIWTLIRPQIDSNMRNFKSGKNGGRPKKKTPLSKNKKPPLLKKKNQEEEEEYKDKEEEEYKQQQGGEIFKKLESWLKGMDEIKNPKAYAKTLFQKYDEEILSRVLKDCACVSLQKFSELAGYHTK